MQRETTENYLLRLFAQLCQDGVWGVRKACAETFMAVSGLCLKGVRYQVLAPLFVGLLCDKSRWVQMAAYQALGQFIATFAEPEQSGFIVNEDGQLIAFEGELSNTFEYAESDTLLIEDASLESDRDSSPMNKNVDESLNDISSTTTPEEPLYNEFEFWRVPLPSVDIIIDEAVDEKDLTVEEVKEANEEKDEKEQVNNNGHTEDEQNCNTEESTDQENNKEQTDIETNSLEDSKQTATNGDHNDEEVTNSDKNVTEDVGEENGIKENGKCTENGTSDEEEETQSPIEMYVEDFSDDSTTCNETTNGQQNGNGKTTEVYTDEERFISAHDFYLQRSDDENSDEENVPTQTHYSAAMISNQCLHQQKLVPPALLEHYISMTEPSKAQTIDGDLPRHCAYTLPGVVLALGSENWSLLRDTYVHLSTDMQWKVRRTLAFSIHDLALVLGQKICVDDLVHVFNQFAKDLDEVCVFY